MFYVYVLKSNKTGRRYVGSCENVSERLQRHNLGHSKATLHGVPWILLHIEEFGSRAEATRKERYFKSGRGRDELDKLPKSLNGRRGDRSWVRIPAGPT
jgi:putative endonuclease